MWNQIDTQLAVDKYKNHAKLTMLVDRPGNILLLTAVLASIIPALPLMAMVIAAPQAAAQSTSSASEIRSDFNGDGYDDLAIGVPEEDLGTKTQVGAVHVLYGSSSSLQTSSPADQFWHQNSPGVEDSEEFGDRFGSSLAAGDFNGDGFDDLAVSAYDEDIGTANSAGAVHILYGSENGLQTSSPADQFWHQNSPGVEDTSEPGDQFGVSLATGDFNNDGYDELAVGVRFETFGGDICCVGATHVLYGSSSGLQTSSPADQLWNQDSAGVEDSTDDSGGFGRSLASGDFNDDGYDDLGIGAPSEKIVSGFGEGAVHVLYGSSSGLQTSSPADQFWHQNSNSVKDNVEEPDGFGVSLAAGDFNNDGFDDLAIGVPSESIGSFNPAGAVNVLYGSASGLRASASGSTPDDQFWNQDSPGVNDVAEQSDSFGYTLSSGDFNGDGLWDLAIGVPGESIGSVSSAGAIQILYGSASGLQTSSPADQFWHQNSPGVEDTSEQEDQFGSSLVAADFNGDGKHDLAIGSYEDVGTACDEGAINILYGSSSGLRTTSPADQFWHQNSPGVEDAAESRDFFGVPVFGGNCP